MQVEHIPLQAVVDRNACCGYAVCAELCPDVFKLDDQGFAYVEGTVPRDLEVDALEAGEACPEEAITFVRAAP